MKSVSPNIFTHDLPGTIAFYQNIGFQLTAHVPDEQPYLFAMMQWDSVIFMFQTFESLGEEFPEISRQAGGSLLLYVQVKHIVDLHDRLKNSIPIRTPLVKTFYGATEFSIVDNNGYVLTFAEDV